MLISRPKASLRTALTDTIVMWVPSGIDRLCKTNQSLLPVLEGKSEDDVRASVTVLIPICPTMTYG